MLTQKNYLFVVIPFDEDCILKLQRSSNKQDEYKNIGCSSFDSISNNKIFMDFFECGGKGNNGI